MKKLILILFVISLSSCATKQSQLSEDWFNGYSEGHKDGRWMGYKLGEMEAREKYLNKEVIHESD